ncbi:MAG: PucR family transcriptional regulator [Gordonia sp. (in: high G+C Gram-positive bacteria)]
MADTLNEPVLRDGQPEILECAARLDRPIRWVHVLDLPDSAGLLTGGELVLSTGAGSFGHKSVDPGEFARCVAKQGAAALVVELGTAFIGGVPQSMRESARAHDLPLIVLHRRVRFVEVTRAIHTLLIEREMQARLHGANVYDDLTELILRGARTDELVAGLAVHAGNPVVLEDRIDSLPPAIGYAGAPRALTARAFEAATRAGASAGDTAQWLARDIEILGQPYATLWCLAINHPLDGMTATVVEYGARVIALRLKEDSYRRGIERVSAQGFLTRIINGQLTEDRARTEAARLGMEWSPDTRLRPFLVSWRTKGWHALGVDPHTAWQSLMRELTAYAGVGDWVIGLDGDRLAAVCRVRAGDPRDGDRCARMAAVSRLREMLEAQGIYAKDFVVLLGSECAGWWELASAFRRLNRLAPLAARASRLACYDARRFTADELIMSCERSEVEYFVREQLRVLMDGTPHSVELLMTLRAFLECGGHKSQAASTLHVERSTLYKRLTAIERALDTCLDDSADILNLTVALHCLDFLESRET